MDIIIEENRNNIKSKQNFQKDYYLNKLFELSLEYNTIPGFNNFVNVLFYAKKKSDYDNQFIMFNMTYPNSIKEITQIYR